MNELQPGERRQFGTGIPPAPFIEVNETTIDTSPFNFQIGRGPTAQVVPKSISGGGGPPCDPCAMRHLSIKFRIAGSLQTDGCFPNSDLVSWDCGLFGSPDPYEVDILPCSGESQINQNFTRDYSDDVCTDWEVCGGSGDPNVCAWHGGMTVSYDGINTFHFGYGSNTYTASVITTRICNDIPTDVSAIYDASVLGYPDLPPDIVVDDWCAAIGTELFSYNFAWFIDYMTGTCDCFGGDKRIIGIFGLYIYIDVT